MDFEQRPQAQSALTIAKPSALQRCCRPCVRCLPAVAIWSPSLSVVATVVVAGVINVNSAHYLELPSTESYVHMVQAIRLMDKTLMSVRCYPTYVRMGSASIHWVLTAVSVSLVTLHTLLIQHALILMSVLSLQNLATLSVRIQKEASTAHVQEATFYRRMGRCAEILMNVQRSSTTVSSCVSTPLEDLRASAHPVSHNITLLALITMNVHHNFHSVDQRDFVRTHLEVSAVIVSADFLLIKPV